MSTLTKLALGAMGQLRPRPAKGDARSIVKLPAPDKRGGLPLMVVEHSRMKLIPVASRESYASVAAGAIAQNVYLYAASCGLASVIRAWIDRSAIADALGLTHEQHVLLSQTVGYPTA